MSITFYCGIACTKWDHHPVAPGQYTCIAPTYGRKQRRQNHVFVPRDTEVLLDSGAFSDSWATRISFEQAYDRQEAHAEKFGYLDQIKFWASYDLLIDEVWDVNGRHKQRWTAEKAEEAVNITVAGAKWLHQHRNGIPLAINAQGVDAPQYLRCVQRLMPFMQEGDLLGLGGWCIIGMFPHTYMPVFERTLELVMPFLSKESIKRVHIYGVIYPPALGLLLWWADQYGIALSTDSTSPSLAPIRGKKGMFRWLYGKYTERRPIPPVDIRGLVRAAHVEATRTFLSNLRNTIYYKPAPITKPIQLRLFA